MPMNELELGPAACFACVSERRDAVDPDARFPSDRSKGARTRLGCVHAQGHAQPPGSSLFVPAQKRRGLSPKRSVGSDAIRLIITLPIYP
jgi:hypothetical protein